MMIPFKKIHSTLELKKNHFQMTFLRFSTGLCRARIIGTIIGKNYIVISNIMQNISFVKSVFTIILRIFCADFRELRPKLSVVWYK